MICTTLNKIRDHHPCKDGWEKLLKSLNKTKADDEPLPLEVILDSNGLDDALWCLRTLPEYDREWRLFAVSCARKVQYLMQDERSINALDIAEKHANGQATNDALSAARAAASDAWAAAWDARAAAWAAAGAAAVDAWAAGAAAGAAARAAARAAASDAAGAAWDAARAARAAAWDDQEQELRRIIKQMS